MTVAMEERIQAQRGRHLVRPAAVGTAGPRRSMKTSKATSATIVPRSWKTETKMALLVDAVRIVCVRFACPTWAPAQWCLIHVCLIVRLTIVRLILFARSLAMLWERRAMRQSMARMGRVNAPGNQAPWWKTLGGVSWEAITSSIGRGRRQGDSMGWTGAMGPMEWDR